MNNCVCPCWVAYTFDNRIRRLFHNPKKIFGSCLQEGMTAIDIGCGIGFFSIGMAKIVGEKGCVISADLQQNMLDTLEKRAERAGVAHRIRTHLCEADSIGIDQEVDLALTFWMVHEVPNVENFLTEIYSILKPTGKYLLAEPKLHVSRSHFEELLACANQAGFKIVDKPRIYFSRAALLEKS